VTKEGKKIVKYAEERPKPGKTFQKEQRSERKSKWKEDPSTPLKGGDGLSR